MRTLLVLAAAILALGPARAQDDWVVRPSAASVEETVERLQDAIDRSGSKVLAIFDHRAAAQEVGLDLPESTVVLFAKPKTFSPLIAANPRAAMDMPQRILVWEEEGATYAGFVSPSALVSRHGFDPHHPELSKLRATLETLVDTAVNRRETRMDAPR